MEFDFPLPERWKWVPLGELADPTGRAIVSGPFGSNISSKFFVKEGIPVIRGNNLTTGAQKFIDNGFVFVTPEKAKELGNVDAICDDLVFTAAGSLGQVGIIPERTRFNTYIISNKQMRVRLNRELIHPLFAFQWLSSSPMVEFIQRQNTGSSVPLINLSIIRRLPVPLPPLAEQRAIAAVLGALDDKIELNRRMNATLESMARALFQSWFVDFDPVRAKLDGRQPIGLDPVTAALFPDQIEHATDGVLPSGWERKRWGDIATLEYGKSIRDYRQSGGKYRVFGTNGPIGFHHEALCSGEGIIIGRKGAYRGVHYSPEPFFTIDTAYYLKPTVTLDLKWAYYELLRCDINSMDSGSAIPSTSRDDFYGIPVIVPTSDVQTAFGKIIGDWFSKILANNRESRTLAALRDTLLPKLLSGELSVAGATQAMEQA